MKHKKDNRMRAVLDAAAGHADDAEAALLERASKMSDEEVDRLVALFEPIENWVILRLDMRSKTASGLYIPGQAAMAKRWCVMKVGPGVMQDAVLVPVPLARGDYPLLSVHARVAQSDEYPRIGMMKCDPGVVMGIDRRTIADFEAPRVLVGPEVLQ